MTRWLNLLTATLACAFIGLYLFTAIQRMNYPFDIEWMEGGHVDHVLRLMNGQSLYVAPALDFVPYPYTPLYHYAALPLFHVLGPGYLPLRFLSFLSSLGVFMIVFLFVRKETTRILPGLFAAGFLAATFSRNGGWFDLARVDSLFVLFLMAGLYLLRFHRTNTGALFAGLLFFLSFLTKQTALLPAVAMSAFSLFDDRRRGILFSAASLGAILIYTVLMNRISQGWFGYYVFGWGMGKVPLETKMFVEFWTRDLILSLPAAVAIAILLFLKWFREDRNRFLFYSFSTAAMILVSWASRLHNGGFVNVLMPLHAQAALLLGAGLYVLQEHWKSVRPAWAPVISILCLGQLLMLLYRPSSCIPTEEDRAAGEQLIARLKTIPGEVLIPYHGYYAVMAGKNPQGHIMTAIDIVVSGDAETATAMVEDTRAHLKRRQYGAIVLDREWFRKDLLEHYEKAGNVFDNERVFWTRTGIRIRPEWIYVPRRAPEREEKEGFR